MQLFLHSLAFLVLELVYWKKRLAKDTHG